MDHTRRPLFHLAVVEGCAVRAACGNSDPGCGWTPSIRAVTCEACRATIPAMLFVVPAKLPRRREPSPVLARAG